MLNLGILFVDLYPFFGRLILSLFGPPIVQTRQCCRSRRQSLIELELSADVLEQVKYQPDTTGLPTRGRPTPKGFHSSLSLFVQGSEHLVGRLRMKLGENKLSCNCTDMRIIEVQKSGLIFSVLQETVLYLIQIDVI